MDTLTLARRKSLFWRVHLWAAFLATPFALIGALTGILYIFTPQIESVLHGSLDRVTPTGQALPLDTLVAQAQQAAPAGAPMRYVVTPETADQSVRVYFGPADVRRSDPKSDTGEHAEHQAGHAPKKPTDGKATAEHSVTQGSIVYLDPYTGQVLGSHGEVDRFSTWAKRLHSSLLQGNGWRWLLELSASWMLVMLLTGLYLWWPRGEAAVLPRAGVTGRAGWKQWHAFVGVVLSMVLLVILVTGLTWSRHAGQQIKAAADWVGQGSPSAPKHLHIHPEADQAPMGWQGIWDAARQQAPSISYQITAPKQAQEPWRITNFDRSQPTKRFTLLMDGFNGQRLYYHGWEAFTLFNKATAIGIPFHRGEFGLWNQALLLVLGVGVLWWVVSGWVMFVRRSRQGLLGLPRLFPGAWRSVSALTVLTTTVLLAAMPVFAISAAGVALVEAWLALRPRPSKAI